jgi:hypothetical protein
VDAEAPAGSPRPVTLIEVDSADPAVIEQAVQAAPPGATIVIGSPRLPVTADRPYAARGLTPDDLKQLLPHLRRITDVQTRERGRAIAGRHVPEQQLRRGPLRSAGLPAGRNEPCPCGSGKKTKKCHGNRVPAAPAAAGERRPT